MPRSRSPRSTLGPLAAFAAAGLILTALVWRRLFFSGLVPVDGNMVALSFPDWSLARGLWLHPHWPLWNPARNLGEPHLADPQTMALYPPQLLLSALPSFAAYLKAWVLLHTAVAAVFAGLLARRWYREPAAVAAAAALAAFNGFFLARVTFPNHFAAASWLFAEAYFLDAGSALGLGVCLALQWLAGFPPLLCVSAAGLAAMAAAKGKAGGRCLAGGVTLSLGLAAAQWLPFLELLSRSIRGAVVGAAGAESYALPLAQAAKELLLPQWYALSPSLTGDPAIVSYYCGLAALALAAWGAARGGRRERVLLAIGAAAAVLSLSAAAPLARALPPLRVFRFPANWLLLTAAATSLLAAAGIARLRAPWRWPAAALVLVDLVVFAQPAKTAWAQPRFLEEPPVLARVLASSASPARIHHDSRLMAAWQSATLESAADYSLMRAFLAPSFGTAFGVQEAWSYQVLRLRSAQRYLDRLDSPERPRLLDEAGVSVDVSLAPEASRVSQGALRLTQRRSALPRVFIPGGRGKAALLAYGPGFARARLELPSPGEVVFSEADYPGWTARVDGRPAALSRFEELFLSVPVPAGAHEVVFSFASRSFAAGAFVSAVSAAVTLALLFV